VLSSVSGTIMPVALGAGAQVTLGGATTATTTANASGAYSFSGLANGAYTVTPSSSTATFNPASASVTLSGASVANVNFTASAISSPPPPVLSTISGTIGPISLGAGASVALTGAASTTTTADSSGNYSFAGLANGVYTVTP